MKIGISGTLVVATTALLVAGCRGAQSTASFVPGESSGNYSWVSHRGARPADSLPTCPATSYRGAGKFTVLAALGAFTGSSFSGSGLSLWSNVTTGKGSNGVPVDAPDFGSRYTVYYGTYKLSSGFVGCFYLAKVNYKGISFHGVATGWPNLRGYGTATQTSNGPLEIAVHGISAKAGSGTLRLEDPAGKIFETGTVTIKGSVVVK